MGRHTDVDGDGLADHDTVDQRDEHAHDDDACDPEGLQPDRWHGVQRDVDRLPVVAAGEQHDVTWRGDRA